MDECSNCGKVLEPSWKFCVRCGEKLPRAYAEPIRAVLRPTGVSDTFPRRRIEPTIVLGIVILVVGVALITYVAVTVFLPRG